MEKTKKTSSVKTLNINKVNDLVKTGNKILRILYGLFIIIFIYVVSLLFKEWEVLSFIGKIFSIISPLFIGWFIAWMLNPIVTKLTNKGVNRTLSVVISYLLMIFIIYLIFAFTVPSLVTQITDIVSTIPEIVDDVKGWIDSLFVKLADLSLENLDTVKSSFLLKIETVATNIQTNLPETAVNVVSAIASGIGKILLSLMLGFYILFDFDKVSNGFINLFPSKARKDVVYLLDKLNDSLYSFVNGTLWLSILLFIVSVIGFTIIDLNAPVLIAFICVITNLIPYIGPYMGAAVAAAVGFTQSPVVGILTLIFIFIVQLIEGNILHPLVMSKKMNLSPISILLSLLIFEYFLGIFGMIIATPAIALMKIIYVFFDEKYNFFGYRDKESK